MQPPGVECDQRPSCILSFRTKTATSSISPGCQRKVLSCLSSSSPRRADSTEATCFITMTPRLFGYTNANESFASLLLTRSLVSFRSEVSSRTVSYTHLRAHETPEHLVCRLLLEKKKKKNSKNRKKE
eukprot:TRINITY_DN355_c0_g1_i14.p1 TRINITY_DN355_c0_g1~~TRINITY_DN355_c0_g1_i14.p1  ORF type:complete len:128 (-),score=14.94 TRINITY_DN355_c0_g1_i14:113-496(-)